MLRKIFPNIDPANNPEYFTGETLNDPVALQTSWSPLKPGGTNFRTRKLVRNGRKLECKPTTGALIFGAIFFCFGIGMAFPLLSASKGPEGVPIIVAILFPLIFGGVGFFLLKGSMTPITFDGNSKLFWHGYGDPSQSMRNDGKTKVIPFDSIHALQVISEWCRGGKNSSSFYSYELNLVMNDGSRYNVMDHGNLRALDEDAHKLASFLNVPLWNGE